METLADDPASGPFLQVGEELVRRMRWDDAVDVLWNGLAQEPSQRGWEYLARAALEAGRYDVARAALIEVDRDPHTHPENARIEILVFERSGRLDAARAASKRFLASDPNDVVVSSVLERLDAPAPALSMRAADPFYTVERAEQYVEIGRSDRALRVYRRIQLANPGDLGIELRIRQLMTAPSHIEDDLSAELTDPGLVPPEPDSPQAQDGEGPSLGPTIAKPTPSFAAPWGGPQQPTGPGEGRSDPDELPTDVPAPLRGHLPQIISAPEADELPTQRMGMSSLRGYIDPPDPEDEETVRVEMGRLSLDSTPHKPPPRGRTAPR